jgi:hypothetical protein
MAARKYLLSLFISSFLSFSLTVFAQSAGAPITKSVKDANGSPVAGAKVDLTLSGLTVRSTVSDASGDARFDGIKEGKYRIAVSARAFATQYREISVGNQPVPITDFVLEIGGVSEVVTVTANRTEITAAVRYRPKANA